MSKPKFKIGDTVKIVINSQVPESFIHTAASEAKQGDHFVISEVNKCPWHDFSKYFYNDGTSKCDAYEEDLVLVKRQSFFSRLKQCLWN